MESNNNDNENSRQAYFTLQALMALANSNRNVSNDNNRGNSGPLEPRSRSGALIDLTNPSIPSTVASRDGAAAAAAAATPCEIVTEVGPHDILLGRGSVAISNVGNIRFRELIQSRKDDYVSTSRRRKKELISKQIAAIIADRGGRFLRKIDDLEEAKALNIPVDQIENAWVEATEDVILKKIKQSLRDLDREHHDDDTSYNLNSTADSPAKALMSASASRNPKRQHSGVREEGPIAKLQRPIRSERMQDSSQSTLAAPSSSMLSHYGNTTTPFQQEVSHLDSQALATLPESKPYDIAQQQISLTSSLPQSQQQQRRNEEERVQQIIAQLPQQERNLLLQILQERHIQQQQSDQQLARYLSEETAATSDDLLSLELLSQAMLLQQSNESILQQQQRGQQERASLFEVAQQHQHQPSNFDTADDMLSSLKATIQRHRLGLADHSIPIVLQQQVEQEEDTRRKLAQFQELLRQQRRQEQQQAEDDAVSRILQLQQQQQLEQQQQQQQRGSSLLPLNLSAEQLERLLSSSTSATASLITQQQPQTSTQQQAALLSSMLSSSSTSSPPPLAVGSTVLNNATTLRDRLLHQNHQQKQQRAQQDQDQEQLHLLTALLGRQQQQQQQQNQHHYNDDDYDKKPRAL